MYMDYFKDFAKKHLSENTPTANIAAHSVNAENQTVVSPRAAKSIRTPFIIRAIPIAVLQLRRAFLDHLTASQMSTGRLPGNKTSAVPEPSVLGRQSTTTSRSAAEWALPCHF